MCLSSCAVKFWCPGTFTVKYRFQVPILYTPFCPGPEPWPGDLLHPADRHPAGLHVGSSPPPSPHLVQQSGGVPPTVSLQVGQPGQRQVL